MFLLTNYGVTGRVIEENYSAYTKALCDDENFCYQLVERNGEEEWERIGKLILPNYSRP